MDKSIRSIEHEIRTIPESRMIEGYALLFNVESNDLGGFTEIIDSKALDGVIERSDVLALYNHEEGKVLARCTNGKGTLTLEKDKRGLKYSFIAPNTSVGNDVLEYVSNGDLRNSSFAFTVDNAGQTLEKRSDGTILRTITKFSQIYDVSPVWNPAYSETTVFKRSLEEFKQEKSLEDLKKETEEKQLIEAEERKKNEMIEYYNQLDKILYNIKN